MSLGPLGFLVIVLGAAVALVPLSTRFGMGSVIGYLLAGLLLGPKGLALVEHPEEILHWAEYGVVFLLFLIGLELNPQRLWKLRRSIIGLGILQILGCTILLTAGLTFFLDWQPVQAVVAALGLAMSSTAIAMQIIGERGLKRHPLGQQSFAILLFQDLAVIPALLIVTFLAPGKTGIDADASLFMPMLKALLAIVAVIVAGRYLTRPVYRWIAQSKTPELSTAFSLLIVLHIAYLMTAVGLSMALGTFLAGVVLAESEYRHELEANLQPFKGLLLGLFFLTIGMTIRVDLLAASPGLTLGLVCGLLLAKTSVIWVLLWKKGLPKSEALLGGLLLSQGGEFAFVLLGEGLRKSVLLGTQVEMLNGAVTISMLTTPILLKIYDHVLSKRPAAAKQVAEAIPDEGHPVIIAGFGRMGQIIARLLNTSRFGTTVIDHNPTHIDRIRQFGQKAYYGDASQIAILQSAGLAHAKLLIITIDHPETVNTMITEVRRLYPDLPILARARDRSHVYQLLELGVTQLERETYGSALSLGQMALNSLGVPAHQSWRLAQRFRRYDLALIQELYPHHRDEKRIQSAARTAQEQIERLFAADSQAIKEGPSDGWT